MKFSIENEELISIRIIICTILPVYLSKSHEQ
jgi:hypothetical protein